jgi:tRNA(Met) cytidine acetyltransferase
MPAPTIANLTARLRATALATGQRRALVLSGPAPWTLAAVRQALANPITRGTVAWLTGRDIPEPHLALSAGARLLGGESDTLVYDAHGGLDPDSLGAALGTLRGGGLLILLTPDLEAWPDLPDPLATPGEPPPRGLPDGAGRLVRRLVWVLVTAPGVTLVHPDRPLPPALPDPGEPKDRAQPHVDRTTPDQGRAIAAILKAARGRARRPLVITSNRGRGKSSALGLAAAHLMAEDAAEILVTAPRHGAVAPVFTHAGRLLGELGTRPETGPGLVALGAAWLKFLPPDTLAHAGPRADLLLVDEAAGIPAPLLEALLRRYPRVVFASTVHGYEGTGRGFEVRFRKTLDRMTPDWRALTLTTPIRWAADDPIEALAARALLLDAAPAPDTDLAAASPGTCTFERLDRDALAADEPRLRELFGLLVLAHYQTSPADLGHLLDAPGVRLYALHHAGHIAATALGAIEGGFPADLAAEVFAGRRRPRGHLLPQTLSAHAGIEEAPGLAYLRLVRVAVHPAAQGRGLGQALLDGVKADAAAIGLDLIGASFGATADLLGFWRHCGLPPAHIGTSRNAASGAHAAVVLAGLTPAGLALADLARRRLTEALPTWLAGPLRNLEPALALTLSADPTGPAQSADIDPRAWRELAAFGHAARPYEAVIAPLARLAAAGLANATLSSNQAKALIAAVLQHRGLAEVAALIGATGRGAVIATLRAATRALLRDLAPADLAGYVRDLSRDPGTGTNRT